MVQGAEYELCAGSPITGRLYQHSAPCAVCYVPRRAATIMVPETSNNTNPSLFYFSVTDCNGLSCPPYENNHILSCAVCTQYLYLN